MAGSVVALILDNCYPWQAGGCELTIGYLWYRMDWLGCLDVTVLAFMLAYVLAVLIHVSYRCHLAQHAPGTANDNRTLISLAADLNIEVVNLKSISSIAPYLGLVGTCVGILGAFTGIGMEKHTAMVMITSNVAAALVITAAGILVAVPATFSYNYLLQRIDLLRCLAADKTVAQGPGYSQVARRRSSTRRFSQPMFAQIAAPGLAVLVAVYMPFFDPRRPTRLDINLASAACELGVEDRPIVLHITDAGEIFLNFEKKDSKGLAARLSEIYSVRAQRTPYLVVDDGVPSQTVADAIDTAQNAPAPPGEGSLDIRVGLITPGTMSTGCVNRLLKKATPRTSGAEARVKGRALPQR